MGLINRIRRTNVTRTVLTQMAQISILCGLVASTGAAVEYNQGGDITLSFISIGILLITSVIFIGWLVWFIYVVCTKRILTPMDPRGYQILDLIDLCLFIYWMVYSVFRFSIGIWIVPIVAVIWTVSFVVAKKYRYGG